MRQSLGIRMDSMKAANLKQFEAFRPLMLSIAYRMLGSMTEAEDMVQEAYLRYQTTPPEQIKSHKAFLSTIITRLCINHLQSARIQRETYIGPWLPEPVLTETSERLAPEHQVELYDSISIAFLTLLELLTPLERAVFLLREVFDYEYAEIADIIDKEEAACRQLFSRAKKHIAEHYKRFKPTPEMHRQILNEFVQAVATGEFTRLLELLSEDVIMWADGGGKARGAATHLLRGRNAVAQFVLASTRFLTEPYSAELASVNGEFGVILRVDNKAQVVLSISVDQKGISAVYVIGNPDKLTRISKATNNSDRGIR